MSRYKVVHVPAKSPSPVMLDNMLRPLTSDCLSNARDMSDMCSRPNCTVLCKVCGFITTGRLKLSCPKHPQTEFLMDISRCPQCLAYPFMMEEITTEQEEVMVNKQTLGSKFSSIM